MNEENISTEDNNEDNNEEKEVVAPVSSKIPHEGRMRNKPCPCGSEKKYKKCCLIKE